MEATRRPPQGSESIKVQREENTNSDLVVEDWDSTPIVRPTSETSQTESTRSENVHVEKTPNTGTSDNDATEIETAPTDPIQRYPTGVHQCPSYFRDSDSKFNITCFDSVSSLLMICGAY